MIIAGIYQSFIESLNFVNRLIDFIESYPYITPYVTIIISEDPLWLLGASSAQYIFGSDFIDEIYESRDGYIFASTPEINLDYFLLEKFSIDIDEDEDFKEVEWTEPDILDRLRKKYPDAFKQYDKFIDTLNELINGKNIVLKEVVDEVGNLYIEIGKKISTDKIVIVNELLEILREAYKRTYRRRDEDMKIRKNGNYYKGISELRTLVYQARKKILQYKRENKPINRILISNATEKHQIKVL